jgi:hypothetical protein
MTLFRSCVLAISTTLAASSLAAHADTFNFTVNGSAGGFSGSGVLTTTIDGSGNYLITGISGTGVTGIIAPGDFNNNDNLLFPSSSPLLDSQGFSFSATEGPDQFEVNIFNDGTGYLAFFRDEDAFTTTLPVSFDVSSSSSPVPEPSTFLLIGTGCLGAVAAFRKKITA